MEQKEWIKREDGGYELELGTGQKAWLEKVKDRQNCYRLRWSMDCHSYGSYIIAQSDENAMWQATLEIYNKCIEMVNAYCKIRDGLPDVRKLYREAFEKEGDEGDMKVKFIQNVQLSDNTIIREPIPI